MRISVSVVVVMGPACTIGRVPSRFAEPITVTGSHGILPFGLGAGIGLGEDSACRLRCRPNTADVHYRPGILRVGVHAHDTGRIGSAPSVNRAHWSRIEARNDTSPM